MSELLGRWAPTAVSNVLHIDDDAEEIVILIPAAKIPSVLQRGSLQRYPDK